MQRRICQRKPNLVWFQTSDRSFARSDSPLMLIVTWQSHNTPEANANGKAMKHNHLAIDRHGRPPFRHEAIEYARRQQQ